MSPHSAPRSPSTPPSPRAASAAARGASWIDVGGTDGGVTFGVNNTYTNLVVDQLIMPVGARLTDMAMSITTKMSEITLANLNTTLNNICSTGGGSGYNTMDIQVGTSATQPSYLAMIIDGWTAQLNTGLPALRQDHRPQAPGGGEGFDDI